MQNRTPRNLVWGVVLLALALVLVLHALQLMSPGIYDLILRAWPALLVLAGLSIFLRTRVALGTLMALVLSLALAGGVAAFAFSSRAAQQREDYHQPIAQPVSGEITLLRLRVSTLTTDVEVLRSLNSERLVIGEFVGSSENSLEVVYSEEGTSASLLLVEKQVSAFPLLENVGRGALRVELPPDLPLDVELVGANGTVRLSMSGLAVERMNLNLQQGNALVMLPVYKPLGSQPQDSLGTLAAQNGDLTLFVPPEIAARFEINRGGAEPVYDPTIYNALFNNTVLEARNIDVAEIVVRYNLVVPRGRIRLEIPEA